MAYQSIHNGANVDAAVTRALVGGAIDQEIALKAPIASPALTGTPTAPTQAAGDNSTKIATTEYADRAIMASLITESVGPSAVASFSDGADGVPIKSGTFTVVPAQSGSGDPAPDNVRPITGWTGAKIYRTDGDNLLSGKTWTIGSYYNDSGEVIVGGSTKRMNTYIPVEAGQPYMLSCSNNPTIRIRVHEYDAAQNWLRQIYSNTGEVATWTASSDAAYIRMSLGKDATDIICSLGTVYNIDWTDEAGTVYGGTLQYLGGGAWKLTATYIKITIDGTISVSAVATTDINTRARFNADNSLWSGGTPKNGTHISDVYFDRFKSAQDGSFTYSAYLDDRILSLRLPLSVQSKSDANAWFTANPTEFCYPLAAPTTYDLTGADVLTLLGENVIWADVGSAAVEYRADTKLYIDNAIAAL